MGLEMDSVGEFGPDIASLFRGRKYSSSDSEPEDRRLVCDSGDRGLADAVARGGDAPWGTLQGLSVSHLRVSASHPTLISLLQGLLGGEYCSWVVVSGSSIIVKRSARISILFTEYRVQLSGLCHISRHYRITLSRVRQIKLHFVVTYR